MKLNINWSSLFQTLLPSATNWAISQTAGSKNAAPIESVVDPILNVATGHAPNAAILDLNDKAAVQAFVGHVFDQMKPAIEQIVDQGADAAVPANYAAALNAAINARIDAYEPPSV